MIIWLASYPKSGNTWVRTIINELIYTDNNYDNVFNNASKNIRQFPAYSDFKDSFEFTSQDRTKINKQKLINTTIKNWINLQNKINQDKKIKLFKTHNLLGKFKIDNQEYSFTNLDNTIGVIHIVRDPRSIISSLKNHFSLDTEEEAKEMILDENTWSGLKYKNSVPNYFSSWSNHFNSWKRFPKNNHLIKYEDILENPVKEITRIVVYLQRFFKLELDEKRIINIAEKTSFKNFKKNEENGKFYENALDFNRNKKIQFFFLGPENNWRKLLKQKTILEIENKFNIEMKELKYI
tara:strand:- start:46 stop:927 length:882 start_codon:yes stop_codon:yes gene_type:complete